MESPNRPCVRPEHACMKLSDIKQRDLSNKKIAILSTDGFEQSELTVPKEQLEKLGATVHVIAPPETKNSGEICGWSDGNWGDSIKVDKKIDATGPEDYDALVLPGGVMNPDKLRMREDATAFIRSFFKAGKPVAAICHGPQILIDCGVLDGREVTSYPSIKNDLKNAGARWTDHEVVVDQALVTSRTPDDLPAFINKIAEEVLEGVHAGQKTA